MPPRAEPPVRCSSTPKTCRPCAPPGSRRWPPPMSPDHGVPVIPGPAGPAAGGPGPGGTVPVGGGDMPGGPRPGEGVPVAGDDLALVAAKFGAALRAAGVPADPGRRERFAGAVSVARPVTISGLYLCALATLVASKEHIETLRRVFEAIFGGLPDVPVIGGEPSASGPPDAAQGPPASRDILREAGRGGQSHIIRSATDQAEAAGEGDEHLPGDEELS